MFENPFVPKPKEQIPDALKSEHLKEGAPVIMASINNSESLDVETKKVIDEIRENGDFVNFHEEPLRLKEQNMLSAEKGAYVISGSNENNKWSEKYWVCTGIVVVGTDKKTKKEISFLSHQYPGEFLKESAEAFEKDLTKRIKELLQKCEGGTVDAVVFGGVIMGVLKEYEESIKRINEICKKNLGFEPVVVTGPSTGIKYPTEIYLDTQKRRLYLVRPPQPENKTNQSYTHSNIEEEKKKWDWKR